MWNGIYNLIDLGPETVQKLRIPAAVQGCTLIVLPGRILGRAVTTHLMVFTALVMLDHRPGGLRVLGRMFGLISGAET